MTQEAIVIEDSPISALSNAYTNSQTNKGNHHQPDQTKTGIGNLVRAPNFGHRSNHGRPQKRAIEEI